MSLSDKPSQHTSSLTPDLPLTFFQEKCGVKLAGSTKEILLRPCATALLIAPSTRPTSGHPPAARYPQKSPPRATRCPPTPRPRLHACPQSTCASAPSRKTIPHYSSSPQSRPNETPKCCRAPASRSTRHS